MHVKLPSEEDSLLAYRPSGAIPDVPPVRIVHISDLHFITSKLPEWCKKRLTARGMGDHNEEVLYALRSKIRQLRPEIIVASGDLATLGDRASTEAAFSFLSQLALQDCNLDRDHLIVIPGNHDSLLKYLYLSRNRSYDQIQGSFRTLHELTVRGIPIFVFCFDSSISRRGEWWPVTASKGRVEPKTFIKFNDEAFTVRERNSEVFDRALKIAVVHHHPLPVPNKDLESFTVMQNGGTFIAHMQSNNINLVLHGHEHFPYSCTYRYDQNHDWTIVVSAGTASQNGKTTNSFTFLEFQPWLKLGLRQFDYYSEAGFSENFNGGTTFWFQK